MNEGLFRKGMVLAIVGCFVGACVIPSISGDIKPNVFLESKELKNNES